MVDDQASDGPDASSGHGAPGEMPEDVVAAARAGAAQSVSPPGLAEQVGVASKRLPGLVGVREDVCVFGHVGDGGGHPTVTGLE
jgi:hypothetical protein